MDIDLALISHTNLGKTTLARTLLRQDVGEVLDRSHVTEVSEVFDLIATPNHRLRLWDTPGFGDSARLLKRLRAESNPVGWFLHQVWDRWTDRPLWCGQQAARTIRDEADVVLYLVNATEVPDDAGYARLELELLSWIGRPVLVLLNQRGDLPPGSPQARQLEADWLRHAETWPVVEGVLSLDAFSRCWVEEHLLLRRVAGLLGGPAAGAMEELTGAWRARNVEIYRASLDAMASYLTAAAQDRQELSGTRASKAEKAEAMQRLSERMESRTQLLMDSLIRHHGLRGRSTRALSRGLDAFLVPGGSQLSTERSALVGGAVSGALGGLAADMLAGGLTFGGGLVAGAILGALGAAGLSRAVELVRVGSQPAISWSPRFLLELTRQTTLRYLAVAHFGRGRGEFQDADDPAHWREAVDGHLEAQKADLGRALRQASEAGDSEDLPAPLRRQLEDLVTALLVEAYPEGAAALRAPGLSRSSPRVPLRDA